MQIVFNGEECSVSSTNVAELLSEFSLENRKIAVELNREIIPRSTYAEQELSQGDRIEIVSFVGGG